MISAARLANGWLSASDRAIPAEMQARPAELRAARHLILLAAITGISAPLLTVMYHLLGYEAAGRVVLTGGLVMLVAPFTLNAGVALPIARDLFLGALYILKIWLVLHLGGLGSTSIQWFVLCPMIALLLGGARPGLAWSAIVALTVAAIFVLERSGGFIVHPGGDQTILNLVGVLGLFALLTIVGLLFADDRSAAKTGRA